METQDIFEFIEAENGKKVHKYKLNGKDLTGVTTVLNVLDKPYLVQWSANMAVDYIKENSPVDETALPHYIVTAEILEQAKTAHRRKKEDAGDKGKDLHAIIEMIIGTAIAESKGVVSKKWLKAVEMLVETPAKKEQLKNFLEWAKDKKFLESEKIIYSKELWLGGTVDFVYEFKGDVYVGDVKTSKVISPSNFWQTSAYKFMLEERGLYKNIKGFTIVRLGKDGTFEIKDNFSYDDNIEGFKAALTIYRKLHAITPVKKVRSIIKVNKLTTK